MQKQPEYIAGWIDTSIHDFLSEIIRPSPSMAYTLISALDSSFNVSSFVERSKHLQSLTGECKRVGNGLLVKTDKLLKAEHKSRIFFGFDEVWFFPDIKVIPKPDWLTIVGPHRINTSSMLELIEWMQAGRCSFGLGDGIGMNYCLKARGIVKYFVKALNESCLDALRHDDKAV